MGADFLFYAVPQSELTKERWLRGIFSRGDKSLTAVIESRS